MVDVDADTQSTWQNSEWLRFWKATKSGRAVAILDNSQFEGAVEAIPDLVGDMCWKVRSGKGYLVSHVMLTADSWSVRQSCS
jgi:hypothetical protein